MTKSTLDHNSCSELPAWLISSLAAMQPTRLYQLLLVLWTSLLCGDAKHHRLQGVPSRLQEAVATKPVPIKAAFYNSVGPFVISFEALLGKAPGKRELETGFLDLDLYVKCDSSGDMPTLGYDGRPVPEGWKNKTILTTLRSENCFLTWDTLSRIGKEVYLRHVYFFMNETTWDPSENQTSVDTAGLKNMNEIQIRIQVAELNQPIELLNLLPPNTTFQSAASVTYQCYNTTKAAKHVKLTCNNASVTYNGSRLPHLFPNLQSLFLDGVYSSAATSQTFPWTVETIALPFNLSRTTYEQDEYTNGITASVKPNLYRRLISLNQVSQVNVTDFCMLNGRIIRIDLHSAFVTQLPDDCFSHVDNLAILDLSGNKISKLSKSIMTLTTLEQLYLNYNELKFISKFQFTSLRRLRLLDLSYNHLQLAIFENAFHGLESLHTISLEGNNITRVEYRAFPVFSVELNFINLRSNKLSEIPKDCLRFPRLTKCDLDHNMIHFPPGNFTELVNRFEPFSTFMWDPLAFHGEALSYYSEGDAHDTDQTEISLQNNNITRIPYDEILVGNADDVHLRKEKLAALLTYAQLTIAKGSDLACDCELLRFRTFLVEEAPHLVYKARLLHTKSLSLENFRIWSCNTYRILHGFSKSVSFLDSSSNEFLCPLNASSCPGGCHCYKNLSGTRYFVDCKGSNLTQMPQALPTSLESEYVVLLDDNRIEELPDCQRQEYKWLNYVTRLSLNNNHLIDGKDGSISTERFLLCLKRVQVLDLSVNYLQYIPSSIQKMNFTTLKLAYNRIDCCGATWLRRWLYANGTNVTDYRNLYCSKPYSSLPIAELEPADFDCTTSIRSGFYAVAAATSILITLGFCLRHRKDLYIMLYATLQLRIFDVEEEVMQSKYDAYLMYSDKDYRWSQMTLLVGLGTLGFKLYDKNRDSDFRDLNEQIDDALATSRRVIVVLSNDFLEDPVCLEQFERVMTHNKNRKNSRYIIIVSMIAEHNAIPLRSGEAHEVIARHIRHGCFTSVFRKDFWQRLLYWLPERAEPPKSTDNMIYEPLVLQD